MSNLSARLLKLALSTAVCMTPAAAALAQTAANPELERLLRADELVVAGNRILTEETLLEIYEGNGFSLFWENGQNVRELLELVEKAPEHGLDPSDYFVDQVREILNARNGQSSNLNSAESDILLTGSLLRYGYHRRLGKVNASKLDPDINFRREAFRDQPPHILSLIHISEPTRPTATTRMPSSA